MRCHVCGRKGVIFLPYLGKWLCEKHFLKMMRKRFGSNLRRFFKKGEALSLPKGKTLPEVVLRKLMEGKPFRFSEGREVKADYLEKIANDILLSLFEGKFPKVTLKDKPLYNFRYEELKFFADLLGLKYKESYVRNELVEEVVKYKPGALFSLVGWFE